jgi:SpoVK/Ycf46/Vps4 family AAA+-type ATPase
MARDGALLLEAVHASGQIREALDARLRKSDAAAIVDEAWHAFTGAYLCARKLIGEDRKALAAEELRAARTGANAGIETLLRACPQADDSLLDEENAFAPLKTDVYATDPDIRSRLVVQSAVSSYIEGVRHASDAHELIQLTKRYFCALQGNEMAPRKMTERVRFSDVAGNNPAKRELMAIAEDLRHTETFAKYNLNPLEASVLLAGPPGCGKTYLVKAFANEVDLPFHEIRIPGVLSCMYGTSAKNLKRKLDVSGVVFLDEIDALGRSRAMDTHEATASLVGTMCAELDGVGTRKDRIIIAATNLEKNVDAALLRPPRLSKIIRMEMPTTEELTDAVRMHRRKYETNVKLPWELNDGEFARQLKGKSYADVAEMVKRNVVAYARAEYRGEKLLLLRNLAE